MYENLTSSFKFLVGVAGSIIGIMATAAIYFSYSSIKDIKEESGLVVKELRTEIQQMKSEATETATAIKSESKDAVKSTEYYAEKEISRITLSTNQIALAETRKQLENIFATDRIQKLIQDQAVKEIRSKVVGIVDEQTKNISNINDAASTMRIGLTSGMLRLRTYFEEPDNPYDSAVARRLYDKISLDYLEVVSADTSLTAFMILPDTTLFKQFYPIHIVNNHLPISKSEREDLILLVSKINVKEPDLNYIAQYIIILSRITNLPFKPFEVEEVQEWFRNLKR